VVFEHVELRPVIGHIGHEEREEACLGSVLAVAFRELRKGVDRNPRPFKRRLQIPRVAESLVVTGPDIHEHAVPLVLEKVPDDPFLLELGVLLGTIGRPQGGSLLGAPLFVQARCGRRGAPGNTPPHQNREGTKEQNSPKVQASNSRLYGHGLAAVSF